MTICKTNYNLKCWPKIRDSCFEIKCFTIFRTCDKMGGKLCVVPK